MDVSEPVLQHQYYHHQPQHEQDLQWETVSDIIVGVHDVPDLQDSKSKLNTAQHHNPLPLLHPPQSGTPPQLVPDPTAATIAPWLKQHPSQGYHQVWPTHQEVTEGLQDTTLVLEDVTLSSQEFQDPQVSQGLIQVLQECQVVPHLQHVIQSVPSVLEGSQGVPQVLQECQAVSHLQLESHAVPRVPQLAKTVVVVSQIPQEGSPLRATKCQGAERDAEVPKRGRRTPRPRRPKLYEQKEEFADPLKEKRRRDAINSKKNRDAKKAGMEALRRRVQAAVAFRDILLRQVEELKRRESLLMAQLKALPSAQPNTTTTTLPNTLQSTTSLPVTLPPATTLPGSTVLPGTTTLPNILAAQELPLTTTTTTTTTLPTSVTLANTRPSTLSGPLPNTLPDTTTTRHSDAPYLTLATPCLPPYNPQQL